MDEKVVLVSSHMGYEAPESITHVHGEDDVRQVVMMRVRARVVVEEEDDI